MARSSRAPLGPQLLAVSAFPSTMQLTEGAVTLDLPDRDLPDGGPAKRSSAFYNPAMAPSRDVGVLVHRALDADRILDGLAGAGARGLRLAAEADLDHVILNDVDPDAVATIERNVEINDLDEVIVRHGDLADLLAEDPAVDAIDIDPYGTPEPWIAPAVDALDVGDVLAVAATDTRVLHGRHPETMRRRYGAELVRQEADKELGLRILVGYVARVAAKAGLGVQPRVAFEMGHHFRCWVQLTDDAGGVGDAHRCPACGQAWLGADRPCACGDEPETSGPLWTGRLLDPDLLDALEVGLGTLAEPSTVARLVGRLRAEAHGPPLFVDVHRLGKEVGSSVPSLAEISSALREEGFVCTRTHLVETAVRTDAPRKRVGELVAELGG